MARPERRDVDYFPFIVKDGKTLFILEGKYECKGTGFFTNVMRVLSRTQDHHVCIKDDADRLYFFAQCKCDEESGMDMIEMMVKTGKLDKELWSSCSVIVSEDLLLSITDAYRQRSNDIITIDQIKCKYGITSNVNKVNNDVNEVNNGDNPQSKAKQSKAKYSKANKYGNPSAFSPTGDAEKPKDEKPEPPYEPPTKDEIENSSGPRIEALIKDIRVEITKEGILKLADLKRFDGYSAGKNRRAVLHTLSQCYRQRPHNPGGFCRSILEVEDGNFNEREFQRESCGDQGPSREEAAEMLGKIMPSVRTMP